MVWRKLCTLVVVLTAASAASAQENPAYLGIFGENRENAEPGVVVRDVVADGPAAKAGLKAGDVIVAVQGKKLEDYEALASQVKEHKVGDTLELTILRDGKEQKLTVVLQARPTERPRAMTPGGDGRNPFRFRIPIPGGPGQPFALEMESSDRPMLGVQLQPLDDALRNRLKFKEKGGVAIAEVIPNSPAQKADLHSGDVIIAVDGNEVTDTKSITDHVGKKKAGDEVKLKVFRDGKVFEKTLVLETIAARWRPWWFNNPNDPNFRMPQPNVPRMPMWIMPGEQAKEMQEKIDKLEKEVERLKKELNELKKSGEPKVQKKAA